VSDYETEIEIMQSVTKEEYLATLRRYDPSYILLKIDCNPQPWTLPLNNMIWVLFLSEKAVVSQEVYPSIGELQGESLDI